MNHLAHFVLSGGNSDLAIGNFVADFITNRQLPTFTEGVQRGIWLHREIDAFTDAHPIVKQSTKRLHPFHHKYSPVIVDVYYDFLLAKNWDVLFELKTEKSETQTNDNASNAGLTPADLGSDAPNTPQTDPSVFLPSETTSLPIFVESAYKLLNLRLLELPERLHSFLPSMIADDFLMHATTFAGLEKTFARIGKASTFTHSFGDAAGHLETYLAEFDAEFCLFFPDLQNHVLKLLKDEN